MSSESTSRPENHFLSTLMSYSKQLNDYMPNNLDEPNNMLKLGAMSAIAVLVGLSPANSLSALCVNSILSAGIDPEVQQNLLKMVGFSGVLSKQVVDQLPQVVASKYTKEAWDRGFIKTACLFGAIGTLNAIGVEKAANNLKLVSDYTNQKSKEASKFIYSKL